MFIRYKTNKKGRSVPIAKIYSSKEHPIKNSQIDKDALWAIRKLQQNGFEAYVVGGSIRDLILGKKPKDFDIATSASPRQVQRLFWNSRTIGRRFKIVHLFFGEKIIEVTTFRSDEENFEEGNNNVFGSIEQDARRRDFSINSLYYNPQTGQILDFTEAIDDFKKREIRSLIPLNYTFSEDPVRMIRAVKYSVTTGFKIKFNVKRAIKRNAPNIARCSTSRLTDELMKIISSGYSSKILIEMMKYKVLPHLLPCYSLYVSYPELQAELQRLDQKVRKAKSENVSLDRSELIFHFIKAVLFVDKIEDMSADDLFKDIYRQTKILLSPATFPNYEIEKAVHMVLEDYGVQTSRTKKVISALSNKKITTRKASQRFLKTQKKNKGKVQIVHVESEAKSLGETHDL